ncbi:MAG: hypothetical protein AAGA48_36410 [Myxococcota bacterium]
MCPWLDDSVQAIEASAPDAIVAAGARFAPQFLMRHYGPWLAVVPLGLKAEICRLDTESVLMASECQMSPTDDHITAPWVCWAKAMPLLVHALEHLCGSANRSRKGF